MNDTIRLIVDMTSVAIPVVTAFFALFGATLAKLWDLERQEKEKLASWPLAGSSLFLCLVSLALFVATLRMCVKASKNVPHEGPFRILDQAGLIDLAETYFSLGYVSFVVAVAVAAIQYLRLVRRRPQGSELDARDPDPGGPIDAARDSHRQGHDHTQQA